MVLIFVIILCLCFFRAIIAHNGKVVPLSRDFTPESERQRVQLLVRVFSCAVPVSLRQVKVKACKVLLIIILFIVSSDGTCRK